MFFKDTLDPGNGTRKKGSMCFSENISEIQFFRAHMKLSIYNSSGYFLR